MKLIEALALTDNQVVTIYEAKLKDLIWKQVKPKPFEKENKVLGRQYQRAIIGTEYENKIVYSIEATDFKEISIYIWE